MARHLAYRDLVREWNQGVLALEKGNLSSALDIFRSIANPPSKIDFNIGCLCLQQGDLGQALAAFEQTVSKDTCLAVGFFQKSNIYLQLKRYEEALNEGQLALLHLRSNSCIDYKELGLTFVLCASEVLHNIAAAHCRLGRWQEAQNILEEAAGMMVGSQSSQLAVALRQVQDHLFLEPQSVPLGKIFRPPMKDEDLLKEKDFLGQSKIITSAFEEDPVTLKPQNVIHDGTPLPAGIAPPGRPQENQEIQKPDCLTAKRQNLNTREEKRRKAEATGLPEGNADEGSNSGCLLEVAPAQARDDKPTLLKVQVSFTTNLKFNRFPSLVDLGTLLQEEYCRQASTMTVRYKAPGSTELIALKSDEELKNLCHKIQGSPLTLWCQGKGEESVDRPILYRMVAQHSYTSQALEDLTFKQGDVLEILAEVNEEWLEGQCNGNMGIFPKSFAEPEDPISTRL